MTLENLLSTISNIDIISIHDKDGVVRYNSTRGEFGKACKDARSLLKCEVTRIRAYNNAIVILLG